MLMCLDVGNTHIFAGVFVGDEIKFRFRYPSNYPCTSDIFGLFLKNVLRENGYDPAAITAICLSSVVPALEYSINAACIKYFSITPLELKTGTKTGLKIDVANPLELGADRVANAVAAIHKYPKQNIIVLDFGTATTVCAISKTPTYLGGAILPGFKICMEALFQNTAKLSSVEILRPDHALGKTTVTNIQSGLYYTQLGAVKEIIQQYQTEVFPNEEMIILATGGYAHLFEHEDLFVLNDSDLVLHGLRIIWEKNQT